MRRCASGCWYLESTLFIPSSIFRVCIRYCRGIVKLGLPSPIFTCKTHTTFENRIFWDFRCACMFRTSKRPQLVETNCQCCYSYEYMFSGNYGRHDPKCCCRRIQLCLAEKGCAGPVVELCYYKIIQYVFELRSCVIVSIIFVTDRCLTAPCQLLAGTADAVLPMSDLCWGEATSQKPDRGEYIEPLPHIAVQPNLKISSLTLCHSHQNTNIMALLKRSQDHYVGNKAKLFWASNQLVVEQAYQQ